MKQPERTATYQNKKSTIPPGTYAARCYRITYLGTRDTGFKNADGSNSVQNQLYFTFEIPSLMADFNGEQKPLVISSPDINFKYYVADKPGARVPTLNTYIEALLGRQMVKQDEATLDINSLNGKVCLIKVIDNKGYPKVETVMPIIQGMEVPKAFNFPLIFDWADNFNLEVFNKFPEFIQKKIKASQEYQPLLNALNSAPAARNTSVSKAPTVPAHDPINPDEIPF